MTMSDLCTRDMIKQQWQIVPMYDVIHTGSCRPQNLALNSAGWLDRTRDGPVNSVMTGALLIARKPAGGSAPAKADARTMASEVGADSSCVSLEIAGLMLAS